MRLQLCFAVTACILAGSLGGCSYGPRETRAAYEPVRGSTTSAKPLALMAAEGGAIVGVLESRSSGIFMQRITLASDAATEGENSVTVQIDQNDRRRADLSVLSKPTRDAIARELDSNFPSTAMQISHARSRNDFGPFGYAVGRTSRRVACLYAWQYSPGAAIGGNDDSSARSPASSTPSAPVSIRVRLCRQGLSEMALVSLVRAMQVYPAEGGAPYHHTRYAGIGPVAAADGLQAAEATGQFFPRRMATTLAPRHHQPARGRREIVHYRTRPTRYVAPALPSTPPTPLAGSVLVPLPAGPTTSPTASAANPLLAPLQSTPPPPPARTVIRNDEMPLPGAVAAPSPVAATPTRPASTMPLPN